MKKITFLLVFSVFALSLSSPVQAAMNPYVRIGIVAGGSALACGVIADVVSAEEDKSDNSWKAALVCGGIAAAISASDEMAVNYIESEDTQQIAQKKEEIVIPSIHLLLSKDKAGVQYNITF